MNKLFFIGQEGIVIAILPEASLIGMLPTAMGWKSVATSSGLQSENSLGPSFSHCTGNNNTQIKPRPPSVVATARARVFRYVYHLVAGRCTIGSDDSLVEGDVIYGLGHSNNQSTIEQFH